MKAKRAAEVGKRLKKVVERKTIKQKGTAAALRSMLMDKSKEIDLKQLMEKTMRRSPSNSDGDIENSFDATGMRVKDYGGSVNQEFVAR